MNKKSYIIFSLLTLFFLFNNQACTPKRERVHHIAIVLPAPGLNEVAMSFIESLEKLGHRQGENIIFISRSEEEDMDTFIKRMIDKKVDLFFSITTPVTKKVKELTEKSQIPVIFIVNDPVNSGLVKTLKNPGGNLSGIQVRGSTPKTLEWLKGLFHDLKTILVPVSFDTIAARQSFLELEGAAKKLNIDIKVSEVNTRQELEAALSAIPREAEAIVTVHSILINSNIDLVSKKAIHHKIPLVSSGHDQFIKGALMSYGTNHIEEGKQAGRLADALLRGAHPSELPVETADFFLGINLETARNIEVHIPDHFIEQANFVVP